MKKTLLLCLFILPLWLAAQNPREYWEWTKSIGGAGDEVAASFKLKNGYLYITGTFTSPTLVWDNTTLSNNGGRDIFIAKVDTTGNTVWVKSFGGTADDSVSILEINNNNQFVLLCKSASPSIDLTSDTLISPQNFYAKFDEDGNLMKSQILPDSLVYTDIEIDNNGGIYAACNYSRSFVFAGKTVSLNRPPTPPIGAPVSYPFNPNDYWYPLMSWSPSYSLSSALLKYDPAGNELWMKLFHGYPINLQIAYDNTNIIAMFVHRGSTDYDSTFFENRYFFGYPVMGTFPDENLTVVLSNDGVTQRVINDRTEVSVFHDFHFAKNGLGYAATSYTTHIAGTLGTTTNGANLKLFRNGIKKLDINNVCSGNVLPGNYSCQLAIPYDIESAKVAQNSEILFTGGHDYFDLSKIVYVTDSNFIRKDSLYIPNGDSIDLTRKAMDNGAVYFLDNFSTDTITIQNNNYLNLPVINLINSGNNDIFLGRYHRRGYMPLAFNNFDSTIKFCSGNFQINLEDSNVLHYRGKGNVHYRWEPAANFQNPDTLNTVVTMVTDTLTARLIVNDGVDTITKIIRFRTGIESGLRLNLSDTVACGNGIIYASLTGSLFDTCIVKSLCTGNTWRFESLMQVNDIYFYNSPPGCDSFQTFRLEMLENSNYCSDTSTFTVKIKPYYIAPAHNVYVCPGSSYSIPGDTTYTNITGRVWRVKKFINQFGCDSTIITDINVLPYAAGETAYVCEGGSYTFPDGTTLNNIAFQPSGGSLLGIPYQRTRTISSVYGCDSIYITTYLYVKRTNSRVNTIGLCYGAEYTFADGTIFSDIQADTSHTIHFTNINGCDSAVTTAIHVLTGPQNEYASICKGGSYVFPDGTAFNNILNDTSHTSRFITVNNCDSFIVTNIKVLPTYNYIQTDTVCKGGNYTFPGGLQVFNIISDFSHTTHLITFSGCDSNIVTNITVLPTYSFTQNDTVCNGANYIFPDNVLANNITSDLSHTSHLITSSGCDSIIVTNITVLPSYSFTENDTVCKGDNYIFPDNVQATNIISNVNHTSYFVTSSGCDSIIVTNITVISNDTSITKNRAILTANLNDAQYQWIDCNSNTPILSETNQLYTVTLVGRYAVQLIKDGCIDTSACYDISFEDLLRRVNNNNVSISPNPARNIVRVQYLSPSASQINISISDLFGQRVKEESRLVMAGINSFEINIASLPRGVYLLVLYDQAVNNRIVKRIVKN